MQFELLFERKGFGFRRRQGLPLCPLIWTIQSVRLILFSRTANAVPVLFAAVGSVIGGVDDGGLKPGLPITAHWHSEGHHGPLDNAVIVHDGLFLM
ncbi:hypothetical protein BDV23DRAFT_146455, partial [Aspergillus alliaceus]